MPRASITVKQFTGSRGGKRALFLGEFVWFGETRYGAVRTTARAARQSAAAKRDELSKQYRAECNASPKLRSAVKRGNSYEIILSDEPISCHSLEEELIRCKILGEDMYDGTRLNATVTGSTILHRCKSCPRSQEPKKGIHVCWADVPSEYERDNLANTAKDWTESWMRFTAGTSFGGGGELGVNSGKTVPYIDHTYVGWNWESCADEAQAILRKAALESYDTVVEIQKSETPVRISSNVAPYLEPMTSHITHWTVAWKKIKYATDDANDYRNDSPTAVMQPIVPLDKWADYEPEGITNMTFLVRKPGWKTHRYILDTSVGAVIESAKLTPGAEIEMIIGNTFSRFRVKRTKHRRLIAVPLLRKNLKEEPRWARKIKDIVRRLCRVTQVTSLNSLFKPDTYAE